MGSAVRCIVILSDKSSGSSALQAYLVRALGGRHVERTRHAEHETLYWTKAASLLGLPQHSMEDSEVPLSEDVARADLEALWRDNLGSLPTAPDDRALVFAGWRALCARYAPLFIEKSPHHLHQWSALELLCECMQQSSEIGFLAIGLVRNPLDTLHSSWRRWGAAPATHQYEWLRAYRNLQRLAARLGPQLVSLRYEDIVLDPSCLEPVHAFADAAPGASAPGLLNARSIGRAREACFRFELAPAVREVAREFGYGDADLQPARRRWHEVVSSFLPRLRR